MESTQYPTTAEAPPEESRTQSFEIPRSVLAIAVTAIVCFLAGYGLAWFSFNAATDAQAENLQDVVRQAVAQALAESGQGAVAAQPSQQQEAPSIVEVSEDDDPAKGPEDAPIVIVEFSDFRCPYCARFFDQTLNPLFELYEGQIRLVYRDFPVVGGEQAAEAAECADDQGVFWEYHDLLFENQGALSSTDALIELAGQLDDVDVDQFAQCVEDRVHTGEVEADFADGLAYGVRGTPAFFINGRPVVGAQPITAFRQVIDSILAEQSGG